ncbi:hypothetical protein Slin15195_G081970 [Septoria linicola]|uniref:Uncharacterized protein n=1 Tax=Septoria linicola TaxID=215465 RepID=A0A9Q9AX95_9PEZI|nr:hypothetical protein Slin15195_G081970 [Septoria linicola]
MFGHALRVQSIQNGIEDRNGGADRLTLYNADPDVSPQEILPRGGVFAIKEPYYKLATDGGPCVRIDHPSDLIRLEVTDGLMPKKWRPLASSTGRSATDFKRTGNEAFKARDYGVAANHYTDGIDACAETDRDLQM